MARDIRRGRITIRVELCKQCGYCIACCRWGNIALSDHCSPLGYYPAVFVGADRCRGCAICALVCPEAAIEVDRG